MFKHFLLPTDGSALSDAAIRKGLQLAKSINAKVTGIYVMPEFHVLAYGPEMLGDTQESYTKDCIAHSDQYRAMIVSAAKESGVVCDTVSATSDHPYEAIIKAAEKIGCDLIVMASHGRRGIQGLLLGSETQKVLTHSKIPVLVFR